MGRLIALAAVLVALAAPAAGASNYGGGGSWPPCTSSTLGWHYQDASGQWWTCAYSYPYGDTWHRGYF